MHVLHRCECGSRTSLAFLLTGGPATTFSINDNGDCGQERKVLDVEGREERTIGGGGARSRPRVIDRAWWRPRAISEEIWSATRLINCSHLSSSFSSSLSSRRPSAPRAH
ncbi:hypothetical protein FKP32DRAFT_412560 [Trametes sanguinea]|nr:hypothetical protein FKP32DRAFT_412560 [Trametes sanguinea]